MKKIKKISVRVSEHDYKLMLAEYLVLKHSPNWTELIYKTNIKSFSDYIRLMIEIGMND